MTTTLTLGQLLTTKNVEGTELPVTQQQEIWEHKKARIVAAAELTLFVARVKSSLYKQVADYHRKNLSSPLALKVKVLCTTPVWDVLKMYVVEKSSSCAEVQEILDSFQVWLHLEGLTMSTKLATSPDRVRNGYDFDFVPAD
jgi:hypothetical protein